MSRYPEDRERSLELLRLVIPLNSQQVAGFHPVSYAVWYEYAAGTNPALRNAIDELVAAGTPIDDDRIYALHAEHVAARDQVNAEMLRAELERMIAELSCHAASAGEQASVYSESLHRFDEQLGPATNLEQIRVAVGSVLASTRRMSSTTGDLQEQLAGSTSELESLRAELRRARDQALTDPLTGIANRRGLEEAVARVRAENGDSLAGVCMLMLDIDHFKRCNDTYGHLFGDKVIRSLADVIVRNVKGQDVAARVGGEEFAVLLPGTPQEGARHLAERLRETVSRGRIRRGNTDELVGNITISLGLAAWREGESMECLMARADRALYASKMGGRNRVTVAPDEEPAEESAAGREPAKPASPGPARTRGAPSPPGNARAVPAAAAS